MNPRNGIHGGGGPLMLSNTARAAARHLSDGAAGLAHLPAALRSRRRGFALCGLCHALLRKGR
jgi:hypothetical protein